MDPVRAARASPLEVLLAAGLYLAGVVLLTWPLAALLGTHWTGTSYFAMRDQPLQAVLLAHQSDALLHAPLSFPHAPFFHPSRWTVFFGEGAFGALPLFLPTYAATHNPVLALNVVMFGGVTLTATALYAVARSFGARPLAAVLAGSFFVVNPWTVWVWGVNTPNATVLWAWPIVIALTASAAGPRVGWLAVALALQALTSLYVAAALFATFLVVGLARLVGGEGAASRRMFTAGALGAAGAALVLGWYGWAYLVEPQLATQRPASPEVFRAGEHLFDGFYAGRPTAVPLLCALLLVAGTWCARRRTTDERRVWWHLLAWIVVGFVLALPAKVVFLHRPLPSPLWILSALGWTSMETTDGHRLGLGCLVGLGLAIAVAAEWLRQALAPQQRSARSRLVGIGVAIAAVASMGWQFRKPIAIIDRTPTPLAFPLRLIDHSDELGVRRALAAIDGPVLHLPIDPLTQVTAMLGASGDRHPLVNGVSTYFPPSFTDHMRAACDLPAPDAVQRLRTATGLAAIVVRHDLLERDYMNEGPYGCLPAPVEPALHEDDPGPRSEGAAARSAWNTATSGRSDLKLVYSGIHYLVFRIVAPVTAP